MDLQKAPAVLQTTERHQHMYSNNNMCAWEQGGNGYHWHADVFGKKKHAGRVGGYCEGAAALHRGRNLSGFLDSSGVSNSAFCLIVAGELECWQILKPRFIWYIYFPKLLRTLTKQLPVI
eukprot:1155546-Pelagomonas_calceolata.AAC.9